MPESVSSNSKVPPPRPRQKQFDLTIEERELQRRKELMVSAVEHALRMEQKFGDPVPEAVLDYLKAHERYASYMAKRGRY